MRKATMTAIAAAALGLSALAPSSGSAASATAARVVRSGMAHAVQYWGPGPYRSDDGWERRQQWHERCDEARVAEAARREAWRIEREREQRRAWWLAERERQSGYYGPGFRRGW